MEITQESGAAHNVMDSGCSLYIKMMYAGFKGGSATDPVTIRQR